MFTPGSKGNKVVSFAPDESDKEDKPGNKQQQHDASLFYFSVWLAFTISFGCSPFFCLHSFQFLGVGTCLDNFYYFWILSFFCTCIFTTPALMFCMFYLFLFFACFSSLADSWHANHNPTIKNKILSAIRNFHISDGGHVHRFLLE